MPKFPTLAHIDFAYTAIPDYFLDHIAPTLKEGELKVMLYILRRTLGYRKLSDSISYDQFIKGITTREGRQLDQGAGVSRRAVVTALASLEEKGLIKRSSGGYKSAATISLSLPYLTTMSLNNTANEQNVLALVSKDGLGQANPRSSVARKSLQTPQEDKKQNLPSSGEEVSDQRTQNLLPGTQILPVIEDQPEQNLHLTLDNHDQKRVNQPTQAVLAVEFPGQRFPTHEKPSSVEQEEVARLITSEIIGLGQPEAEHLAYLAFANGRDLDYVKLLVEYVTTNPSIRVPAAVLTMLIKTNQERQVQPDNLQPINTRFKAISSAKTSLCSVSPDLGADPVSPLCQAELDEIWEECCRRLVERWQFEPTSFGPGGLVLAEQDETALLLTMPCLDSLLRIRISQVVRELLQEKGFYSYRLIW